MTSARKPNPAPRRSRRKPSYVVGIGASAGGLQAFEELFTSMPVDTGMAFVLVTHLAPDHTTLLPELLQRTTTMTVRPIEDGMTLAPNSVYVIPPKHALVLDGERLRLRASKRQRPHLPIDEFLTSLAAVRGTTAIGVVLSGMDGDGAEGLRAIAAAGGLVLVQDPASAEFASMPEAAIAACPTAEQHPPDQLALRIAAVLAQPVPAVAAGSALARVLDLLRRRTGHDLSLYKPSAIERRLERRLAVHRLATLDDYAAYLEANPDEAELLFRELLIGVTQFFRDEEAFLVLRDLALPPLLKSKREPRTLRAWVAGCSSGEEAYSLAIVFHELLTSVHAKDVAVQIYATDIDIGAVTAARTGHYRLDIAQQVSPERLARYFTREDGGYRIRKEIRDTIVFAQHDLISAPPFTRLDVLSCRNVLIYLQPVLQQRLLPQFHYALNPGGLLVLGSSESVSSSAALFVPVDAGAKVFRRLDVARGTALRIARSTPTRVEPATKAVARAASEVTLIDAARRAIIDTVAPPTVVINDRGDVLYSSRRTGRYLEPAVGKTNINIFAMARDGLGLHLTLAVRQAVARRRRVTVPGLAVRGERGTSHVDLAVVPMTEPPSLRGLLLVIFEEIAPVPRAKGRTGAAGLERELARTKTHLQAVVREIESSQAQVDATTEELQSANEELQSTNEELTTSKEELQSLNEELLTLNAELVSKNDDLATANDDLRNLLNSTKIPTLFLDNALRVKRFTSDATRVANLIAGDVGRLITDITLKVDYQDLARDVEQVLETLIFKEVQVACPDGTSFTMRIHPYRTMDNVIDGVVITFSDVTALQRAEEALADAAHDIVIARLLDRWPGVVYVRDLVLGHDVYLNQRAREWLRGAAFETIVHPDDVANPAWSERLRALPDGEVLTRRIRLRAADGTYATLRDRESVLARANNGAPTRVLAVIEDPSSGLED